MPGMPSRQKASVVGSESVSEFAGWFAPRVVMICLPVESQTVNWTLTAPVAEAAAPQPTLMSAYWRPCSPGWSAAVVVNESEAETGRGVEQSGGMGVMWLLTGTMLPQAPSARTASAAPQTAPAQRRRKVLWE